VLSIESERRGDAQATGDLESSLDRDQLDAAVTSSADLLSGGGGGTGGGGGAGPVDAALTPIDATTYDATRITSCRSSRTVGNETTTIECRGPASGSTCTCVVNGELIETCTGTGTSPCSTGNCCGF
jgi:hypothetical protein